MHPATGKLQQQVEKLTQQIVDRLRKAHGERLVSVVLYGSAASEDQVDSLSDINILSVLTQVTPRELAEAEPVFQWWRQLGNPSPLLLSVEELQTSTDCFPMEFHDIQARHRVLWGQDLVSSLQIDDLYYRAQVEHELRAKLLRLRQKAGGVLSDKELLLRLMADALSSFAVIFRHAVILAGGEPCYDKARVFQNASRMFGIDGQPYQALLDLRAGKIKPKDLDPVALFGDYMRGISGVAAAIDRLEKS